MNRLSRKLYDLRNKMWTFLIGISASMMPYATAFAEEKKKKDKDVTEYDFLTNNEADSGMFDSLIETLQGTAASGINLGRTLGYVLIFFMIASIGIGFMVYKDSNKLAKNKDKILVVVVAAVLIFGAGGVALIIANIGDSI